MAVISLWSSPPPSPACRPSPLACHHITTKTAALSLLPPQQPRHRPNCGHYSHRHLNCCHPNHCHHPSHRSPLLPQLPPQSCCHHHIHCSLAPCITWPHLQHHPFYTSTSSMYLFKCQIYYFLCMNVTNLV